MEYSIGSSYDRISRCRSGRVARKSRSYPPAPWSPSHSSDASAVNVERIRAEVRFPRVARMKGVRIARSRREWRDDA